jgi:integrase
LRYSLGSDPAAALVRAVEKQVIVRNPAEAFKKRMPKVERKEMLTLSPEQSGRLLEAIVHTRVYSPVMLALANGMRRGEGFALRWKNVDLEHGALRVMESLEQTRGRGLRFEAPKTDRMRVITLPSFAIAERRRLKRQQAEEFLRLCVRQSSDHVGQRCPAHRPHR